MSTDRPEPAQPPTCRIGLWGTFDLEDVGLMLVPRVVGHELRRRTPTADLRVFAPFGHTRPAARFDAGEPAEPLGQWSPARLDELASALDCVVVGGGDVLRLPGYGQAVPPLPLRAAGSFFVEGLGPEREAAVPVVWNSVGLSEAPSPEDAARLKAALAARVHVAVRDEPSRAWLEEAGVAQELAVVPDCALLAPRLFAPALLRKRLDYLRAMGWYPPEGSPLVVDGDADLTAHAGDLAGADRPVVLLDGPFSDPLAPLLPVDRTYRLPAAVGVEDRVAVLSGSAASVGSSLAPAMIAYAFGRPPVLVDPGGGTTPLAGFAALAGETAQVVREPGQLGAVLARSLAGWSPDRLPSLEEKLDAHFDRIAELALAATASRVAASDLPTVVRDLEARLAAARRAHAVRGERLVAERTLLADRLTGLRRQLAAAEADADANRSLARAEAALRAATQAELEALRQTKVLRWTARARDAYGRLPRTGK